MNNIFLMSDYEVKKKIPCINSILVILILIVITLVYLNTCKSSYFGSGPEIFNPDLEGNVYSNGVFTNDYKIEPVYIKITPATLND